MSASPTPPDAPLPSELKSEGAGRVSTHSKAGTGPGLARAFGGLVIVLAVGFVIAFAVRFHRESEARRLARENSGARALVAVVEARPTASSYGLELPGETAGWEASTIFARVDGYVGSWKADIGDQVKLGQVLATIDTPDMDQQLNAARAKAAASAAQVAVAESRRSIAQVTYDRWRESPAGVVSEQEREEKKANFEEAKALVSAAEAQARLDEAEVSRYQAMEAFKQVTAPYDGVITARRIDIGDLVSAGSSASTHSLYGIAQSNIMRVFVDVPQKAAAKVARGLSATVTSDQFPGRNFRGHVTRTAMNIDPQTRTQRTEVDIANADLALVPGMYVQVTFDVKQDGLAEVPAAAILFRPSGLQVAVIDGANRVRFHPITVARDNGDTVVVAKGITAHDRVALNLNSAVEPGEEVSPVDATRARPTVPAGAPGKLPVDAADKGD